MKEKLQAKLEVLKTDEAQLQANLHATKGAIQIIEQLIAEEEKSEKDNLENKK